MNLAERCLKIRTGIEKQQKARAEFVKAKALRTRAEELKATREVIDLEIKRVEVLKAKGVPVDSLPDSSAALESLADYSKTLEEGSDGRDSGKLKRSLEKVGKTLADIVERALTTVEKTLPSIDEAFLKQVELIPSFADQVSQIRLERKRLTSGVNLRDMNATELSTFLDRRSELRKLADKLNPNEIPKEVLEFFRAVRHGGAPLDKLTDAVKEWLASRDQLKSIRVILKT